MADVVQYRLERTLTELEDLEKRGLFSRDEIAEIVKQRRKFEYRLKRHSPLKEDFLAYIDYEKRLDELRSLRKKSMLKGSGNNKRWKKSVSDFAGVSRIMDIYRLATAKFKGDIKLWFQYLEYCKQKRNGRMKTALAKALRFHPKRPGLWIYAAAWEFDQNLNVVAARALMQRGLRACPNSEDLWVEYLRMELTYLNKLKARKVALGEDEGSLARSVKDVDEDKWRKENADLFMSIDEKPEETSAIVMVDGESKVNDEKPDFIREQGLNILQAVYSGAVEAIPSSFSLRTRFLEILETTDLANSDSIKNEILDGLKRDFSKDPEYWDWLARYEFADHESVKKTDEGASPNSINRVVEVYEEGIKCVPSVALFNLYIKFLTDAIHKDGDVENLTSRLLETYEKAKTIGCITENLAHQHVSFLLELGKLDEAKRLVDNFCRENFPDSALLWALRISLETRCNEDQSHSLSKEDLSTVFGLMKNALNKVDVSNAEQLWVMAFKYLAPHKRYFEKLVEISVMVLTKSGGSDDGFCLSSLILNHALQRDGIQKAREIYKRFLGLPHPGLSFYRTCIELESNAASTGSKDGLTNARKLFEAALATYGQDVSLWREYYLMETKMGTSKTAADVHWRARKTINCNVSLSAADL